ncbi:MAG: GIY-YIG nuclease family protein [Bacteroidales bacterium]|nr:GIY-YIG nuclease family protein [Bacteroidales bacterium]
MKGYMYILLCNDGSYYTGSTNNLELRLQQHFAGEGANHTKKHPPVKLLYYEEFDKIDEAFYREKQVQGWSRKKKEALIHREYEKLPELSRNYTQYGRPEMSVVSTSVVSASSTTEMKTNSTTAPSVPELVEGTTTELVEGTATEPVEGTIVEHFETSHKK